MGVKVLGVDVLLSVGGVVVGSQSNANLKIDAKDIDVSDKTTGGWDTSLVGNRSWGIEAECITLDTDAGQEAIQSASLNGTQVTASIAIGARGSFQGLASIVSMEFTGEKDDKSTMKMSLKGASALAKI